LPGALLAGCRLHYRWGYGSGRDSHDGGDVLGVTSRLATGRSRRRLACQLTGFFTLGNRRPVVIASGITRAIVGWIRLPLPEQKAHVDDRADFPVTGVDPTRIGDRQSALISRLDQADAKIIFGDAAMRQCDVALRRQHDHETG